MGSPRALALCYHSLGAVLFLEGRWDEAHEMLQRSVDLARSFGGTFGEVIGEQRIAQIESARGDYEAARERLMRALQTARASDEPIVRAHGLGRVLSTLALTEFASGNPEAATRFLARGVATQRVVGECAGCDVLLYPAAVPVYLALGDIDLAEEAARKADEVAGAFRSQAWVASGRYLLGLVAAARGDTDMAVQRFDEALERFEALGQHYEIARVSSALAEVSDDVERAAQLRDRADALMHDLRSGDAVSR